jgi:hypothetical protein
MGVLHSTHPMQQASSKWISQASSGVDAVVHAWHVVPTFLTFDNPHNSVYFDWPVSKLYDII